MKNLSSKADLFARLPALIELEPVTYAFGREEESVPMAAEEAAAYGGSPNAVDGATGQRPRG